MGSQRMRFAQLDESNLERLRKLEQAYSAVILAIEPVRQVAELSPNQVARLQELEGELGVILIAYPAD